jgi:transcriptional regulator with XRE-family HTH domain
MRKKQRELELSLKELADKVGVSESLMRLILKGMIPTKSQLILLAQVLKCRIDDLVAQEDLAAVAA